jgi:NADH:ubiquinone oxidoreductase subunit H
LDLVSDQVVRIPLHLHLGAGDQLMNMGWKVLIPLAIINLVVTGIIKVLLH